MELSKLKIGPIRHKDLSSSFIVRIKNYKEKIKEVDTSTLEDTIDSFKRDLHPEAELLVWENIAMLYEAKSESIPNLTIDEKELILKNILLNGQ